MSLHDAKIIYFCLGFVFLTSTFYAVGARFESDLTNGELNLVVEWNSTDDVVVINPNFDENHPLFRKNSLKTVQQQNNSLIEQKRSYLLDPQWTQIPKASIKILKSGTIQKIDIGPIEIKRKVDSFDTRLMLLPIIGFVVVGLGWVVKRSKLSHPIAKPVFSKESAVQAAQTSNWSLLFEILSSNIPWRSELGDLPLDQWQQQWQFAAREPSYQDRQKIIEVLRRSNDCELREIVISEEEKILSEVLEKR